MPREGIMITYRENAYGYVRDAAYATPHAHHACDDEREQSYAPGDASAHDASDDAHDACCDVRASFSILL